MSAKSPGTPGGCHGLTSGVLEQLYNGEAPAQLRLQILSIRKSSKIHTSIDRAARTKLASNGATDATRVARYTITVSDGVYKDVSAFLATRLNHLIDTNLVSKFGVLEVTRYFCQVIGASEWLVVIVDARVLKCNACGEIGQPNPRNMLEKLGGHEDKLARLAKLNRALTPNAFRRILAGETECHMLVQLRRIVRKPGDATITKPHFLLTLSDGMESHTVVLAIALEPLVTGFAVVKGGLIELTHCVSKTDRWGSTIVVITANVVDACIGFEIGTPEPIRKDEYNDHDHGRMADWDGNMEQESPLADDEGSGVDDPGEPEGEPGDPDGELAEVQAWIRSLPNDVLEAKGRAIGLVIPTEVNRATRAEVELAFHLRLHDLEQELTSCDMDTTAARAPHREPAPPPSGEQPKSREVERLRWKSTVPPVWPSTVVDTERYPSKHNAYHAHALAVRFTTFDELRAGLRNSDPALAEFAAAKMGIELEHVMYGGDVLQTVMLKLIASLPVHDPNPTVFAMIFGLPEEDGDLNGQIGRIIEKCSGSRYMLRVAPREFDVVVPGGCLSLLS